MTLRVWPSAVAFDSDARTLPAPLAATLSSAAAPVILLVAGRRAIESGWAPRAAVALADGWGRDGARLVLADLGVGEASLDELLGEASEEGLADVFLFGASLRRVIRTDAARGFGFIPAGASPADSHAVLTDAGWRHVVAHFFREGTTLLAYIPADAEGLDALAQRLGAVIALVGPGDLEALERTLPDDAAVLAVVEVPEVAVAPAQEPAEPVPSKAAAVVETPAELEEAAPLEAHEPAVAAEAVPAAAEPEPSERPGGRPLETPRDARVDALWARREEALARREKTPQVDLVPGRKPTEQERLREPFVLMKPPEPRRRWVVLLLWLGAGVVVGLVILFAILVYLGRTAEITPLSSPGELAPRTDPEASQSSVADSLPYSVAIEAYPRYAPAVERAAQLEREQRGVVFFVTPTQDRGAVFYHVMAGPVADSVGAAALMQRLLDAGVKTGASQWDIVPTRLAFFLGDYASRATAEERVTVLAGRSVPAYVVEVPLPGGPSRWRVYAGAFQGSAEAAVLRPVLRRAGVRDTLVPRIGIAAQ